MRLSVLIIFLSHVAAAQFTYVRDQSVPVSLFKGESLNMPWAGGLNASQFNTMDLNEDGEEDLLIYDRMTSQLIPFLQVNRQYQYAPEYQNFFPEELEFWLLLRDFNGDGRKDIFTGDNLGMKVFENITPAGGLPEWKRVLFFTGFPGPKSDVVLTKGGTFKVNLQLNYDDLPSIGDADGDGDLDIFNAGFSNSSQIEYHQNFSMERYGRLDSLDFERITQQWGGVENCDCGEFSFDYEPCNPSGGRVKHAGGKSLLAMDIDQDNDQDILFSESECAQLYLLRNNGTNESPLITESSLFPENFPAAMLIYPSPYYEDVDFDNKKDLIVSPNIFTREYLQTNLRQSTWFYKNTGTTTLPSFTQPNIDFLQENMIDVGDNAAPVFFDTDGDGDLDLLIGTYADNLRGTVYYYENTGTPSLPAFKLVTEDFMGLSFSNFVNIRPMFADMNGDTRWDFVFTATSRSNGGTQLYYLLNDRYIGVEFTGSIIGTGFFVFPFEPVTLADVNLDRKMDLLIGRQNGSLEYWKNTGTEKLPSWNIEDESFLGLGSDFLRQYPACHTADLDGDLKTDLIFGDQRGGLSIISNYREAADGSIPITNIIYNSLIETTESQTMGGRAWPTVANIFKTDKPAIVVGNALGGLHILKPRESTPEPASPNISVYPNPVFTETSSIINLKVDLPAILYTLSIVGQEVLPPRYLQASQEYQVKLPPLQKGVYLLRFIIEGKSYTRKIIVH